MLTIFNMRRCIFRSFCNGGMISCGLLKGWSAKQRASLRYRMNPRISCGPICRTINGQILELQESLQVGDTVGHNINGVLRLALAPGAEAVPLD